LEERLLLLLRLGASGQQAAQAGQLAQGRGCRL
jgi:hypothetical protein